MDSAQQAVPERCQHVPKVCVWAGFSCWTGELGVSLVDSGSQ